MDPARANRAFALCVQITGRGSCPSASETDDNDLLLSRSSGLQRLACSNRTGQGLQSGCRSLLVAAEFNWCMHSRAPLEGEAPLPALIRHSRIEDDDVWTRLQERRKLSLRHRSVGRRWFRLLLDERGAQAKPQCQRCCDHAITTRIFAFSQARVLSSRSSREIDWNRLRLPQNAPSRTRRSSASAPGNGFSTAPSEQAGLDFPSKTCLPHF